jgi:hypothetical protein
MQSALGRHLCMVVLKVNYSRGHPKVLAGRCPVSQSSLALVPVAFWSFLASSLPTLVADAPRFQTRLSMSLQRILHRHGNAHRLFPEIPTNSSAKFAFCSGRGFTDCTLLFLLQLMAVFVARPFVLPDLGWPSGAVVSFIVDELSLYKWRRGVGMSSLLRYSPHG